MTLEQVLVVVVVVLAPLLNVLLRALKRRLEGPAAGDAEPHAPPIPARAGALPPPGTPRVGAGPTPPPLADGRRSRRAPQVRIDSVHAARLGIALMAVLGPCRGLEAPGQLGVDRRAAPLGRSTGP